MSGVFFCLYIFIFMNYKNVKVNTNITPSTLEHWEHKFKRSVQILNNGGYSAEDLIKKIKEILQINGNE